MNPLAPFHTIGIAGAGAWGSALAQTCRAAGKRVLLWSRNKDVVTEINQCHRNSLYLPNIVLDAGIVTTGDVTALGAVDAVLLAVPAQYLRSFCAYIKGHVPHHVPLVICCKGIESDSGLLMHDIVQTMLPDHDVALLSGPSFAADVARGLPTAVTIAAQHEALAKTLTQNLGTPAFRPYSSTDVVGVAIGGAVKNILAIGCGLVVGKSLGENARAALLTRGLAEMTRLALALGGRAETLMGLSGLGDLVLTCHSMQSRNMALGVALGQGETLDALMAARRSVAEGVATSKAAFALVNKHQIDAPIIAAVYRILHEGAAIDETVRQLLARPFKAESF